MSPHEARNAAFGPPPTTCPQCSHAWHGGRPHDLFWDRCVPCQDAGNRCPVFLRTKPEPTSDPSLRIGTFHNPDGSPTETVEPECALCGRDCADRELLLFAPSLTWCDGDSYYHNAGICRSCANKAARIWAEFDSKKTPTKLKSIAAAHSELKRLARARTVIQPLLDTAILADKRRTMHALAYVENLLTSREEQLTIRIAALDPAFPLAHRTDLPQHEREISAEALAALDRGVAQVKAGQTVELYGEDAALAGSQEASDAALERDAVIVACPVCRAPVGEHCKRVDGSRPIIVHTARRRAAREEQP